MVQGHMVLMLETEWWREQSTNISTAKCQYFRKLVISRKQQQQQQQQQQPRRHCWAQVKNLLS